MRRQQRLFIENLYEALHHPAGRIGVDADAKADDVPIASAEGREDALADGHRVAQRLRHGIGISMVEWPIEYNFRKLPRKSNRRDLCFFEQVILNRLVHVPWSRDPVVFLHPHYTVRGAPFAMCVVPRRRRGQRRDQVCANLDSRWRLWSATAIRLVP